MVRSLRLITDSAASAGWVEVSLYADGREGRRWYGPGGPRPHQPGHVFADPTTAALVRSFEIDPSPVTTDGLSDHARLLLDIALESAVA